MRRCLRPGPHRLDVAAATGYSVEQLVGWEKGLCKPRPMQLGKLVRVLGPGAYRYRPGDRRSVKRAVVPEAT